MTLTYHGHIDWNTSKIISQLISLGFLLSADPRVTDLLRREHPEILDGRGVGYGKKWLLAYKSSNISETEQDGTKITIDDQ